MKFWYIKIPILILIYSLSINSSSAQFLKEVYKFGDLNENLISFDYGNNDMILAYTSDGKLQFFQNGKWESIIETNEDFAFRVDLIKSRFSENPTTFIFSNSEISKGYYTSLMKLQNKNPQIRGEWHGALMTLNLDDKGWIGIPFPFEISGELNAVYEPLEGIIWVSIVDNNETSIGRYDGQNWKFIKLPVKEVIQIREYKSGHVWFMSIDKLYGIHLDSMEFFTFIEANPFKVQFTHTRKDLGSNGGINELEIKFNTENLGLRGDSTGRIFLASRKKGSAKLIINEFQNTNHPKVHRDFRNSAGLAGMDVDSKNNLWVTTTNRIYKLSEGKWYAYRTKDPVTDFGDKASYGFMEHPKYGIFITYSKHIYNFKDGKWVNHNLKGRKKYFVLDHKERVWVLHDNGVSTYNGEIWEDFTKIKKAKIMANDIDGNCWVVNDNEIWLYTKENKWIDMSTFLKNKKEKIEGIYCDGIARKVFIITNVNLYEFELS